MRYIMGQISETCFMTAVSFSPASTCLADTDQIVGQLQLIGSQPRAKHQRGAHSALTCSGRPDGDRWSLRHALMSYADYTVLPTKVGEGEGNGASDNNQSRQRGQSAETGQINGQDRSQFCFLVTPLALLEWMI